jgi:pyruvate dehydrogenase E1 component alpha subunit
MRDTTKVRDIYASMFLLRRAEEVIADHYLQNKIFSFVHFYIGQEAIAVGISSNLHIKDRVFSNHRSHGHYLAKGGNLPAMYAEMLGKVTGCCRGKGGSMHLLDRKVGFMGSTPILASSVPIAVGSSFQQKISANDNLTVVFSGDGAAEEGVFYESLNLAAVLKVPTLFVIENNLYSVNSSKNVRKSDLYDLKKISEGFGLKYFSADGNDVFEVIDNSKISIDYVRSTKSPAILECTTFRHFAHSSPLNDDHLGYRQIDPIEVRKNEDSVKKIRSILVDLSSEAEVYKIESDIDKEILKALEFAITSPEPSTHELLEDVFF